MKNKFKKSISKEYLYVCSNYLGKNLIINFKKESETAIALNNHLVVKLKFNDDEVASIKKNLSQDVIVETYGYVKAELIGAKNLNDKQKQILETNGFNIEDIDTIADYIN